jgi:hypothetical protein
MRIQLKRANADGGLRVIPEIPERGVGLIEGPNGVGKSLAIQLVQLIAGTQPWSDAALWGSLRKAVAEAEIEITVEGLRSGHRIWAGLTPEKWPDDPPPGGDDSIAAIRIDDEDASIAEVGSILDVVRFSATEDLPVVARQEIGREAQRFRTAAKAAAPRIDALRLRSGAIADLLGDAAPAEHEALAERIEEKNKAQKGAAEGLEAAAARREDIGRAIELHRSINGAEVPDDARERLDRMAKVAEAKREERAAIDQQIEKAIKSLAKSGDPQSTLKEADRRRVSREKTLAKRIAKASEIVASHKLDHPSDPGEIDSDALAEEIVAGKGRLKALEAEGRGLDAGSRMLTTIDEISPALSAVVDEGLGDQVIARIEDVDVTTSMLLGGLKGREAQIEGAEPSLRAAELDDQVKAAARSLTALKDLSKSLASIAKARKNLEESVKELEAARDALGKSEEELKLYDKLVADRDRLSDELNAILIEEVELRRKLGILQVASKVDMEAELAEIAQRHDLNPDRLADHFVESEQAVAEAQDALDTARRALDLAQRDRDQATSRLRFAARQIKTKPEFAPALAALEAHVGNGGGLASGLGWLARQARDLADRMDQSFNTLQAIQFMLDTVAQNPDATSFGDSALANAVFASLDERLRERLSSPAIRDALFDGQELRSVDLRKRTVAWGSGETVVERPIESFSTGEQAFAFTQARVLALDVLPPGRDRLLALDEFGAFVAANRRGHLARFLGRDEVAERATQILVVLPLRSNYAEELSETRGELHKRYQQRIEQLDRDGYISEPFEGELVGENGNGR